MTFAEEELRFSCKYALLNESLLVGQTAHIVVLPKLTMLDRELSLSLLKNTSIEIETTDYIDELPKKRNFSNVQFNDDGEYIVSFQVPPNLKQIYVKVSTKVF